MTLDKKAKMGRKTPKIKKEDGDMNVYKNITTEQLKSLSSSEIAELAQEIRETIMDTVSKNGGHLASNLGMVPTP